MMQEVEIDRENEQFNQGVNHVVDLLAKAIGAPDTWHAGDGSEDYDEDLSQTLINILAARGLYDPETGEFAGVLKQDTFDLGFKAAGGTIHRIDPPLTPTKTESKIRT